jgi:hypothetical protein
MLGQASIAVFLPMDKQALERVIQWYVKTQKLPQFLLILSINHF